MHSLVINKRTAPKELLVGAVYVGRPSIFGNPFVMRDESARASVIEKYRKHLLSRPALMEQAKRELRGKRLVCFCAPLACHADVLAEIANA